MIDTHTHTKWQFKVRKYLLIHKEKAQTKSLVREDRDSFTIMDAKNLALTPKTKGLSKEIKICKA